MIRVWFNDDKHKEREYECVEENGGMGWQEKEVKKSR